MRCSNRIVTLAVMALFALAATGCATTTQTGAAIGGIGGALLGGSVGSTIVGAAAGAGIGYLTEQEKQNALEADRQERQALEDASVTEDPDTAYRPDNDNEFVGSTWRAISVEGYEDLDDASQLIVSFQTNAKVTTMITRENGTSEAYVESYGLVDDYMVFSGSQDGERYSVAVRYARNGGLMTLSIEDAQVVFEEVEESGF